MQMVMREMVMDCARTTLVQRAMLAGAAMVVAFAGLADHAQAQVRISQIYGGGGVPAGSGIPAAEYGNDYIELFNASADIVPLGGWVLSSTSASGTSWQGRIVFPNTKFIPPYQYFLVQVNSSARNGRPELLPAPDYIGSNTNITGGLDGLAILSATLPSSGNKIVLMRPGASVALHLVSGVSNPMTDARFAPFISDFVGTGAANAAEGTATVQPGIPSGTNASTWVLVREQGGCQDTNNNAADFALLEFSEQVRPRNLQSPANSCLIAPCGSIDFNSDGLFPDDQDLVDFLAVLAGGVCSTEPAFVCGSIDYNNDGLFPDDQDLVDFLVVLAGGQPGTCR